ncbi:MAG: hypothetical protein K0Q99_2326 [Clostridia bacterium]|jgi:hypothetical protein|nr:hypothetical protein [Clostridia bacterium]
MKPYNDKQLWFRIIAAAADAILFYIGFLVVNQVVRGSSISILFFLITAICGLSANFLPYNSNNKHKHGYVVGSIGLAIVILSIGAAAIIDFHLFTLPIGFIALVFLYHRSYTSYLGNVLYLYTVEGFYRSAVFLFVINAASINFHMVSNELMRYSVLYIIMAVYMLSELKNFRYVSKNENVKRTAFDIAAPIFMLGITVVMSIPTVFKAAVFPFVFVFRLIYAWIVKGILLLTYPLAWLLNYIYNLIELPNQKGQPKPDFKNILGMPEQYKEALTNTSSPFIQLIGKILTFMFMVSICAYAVYLLFKFIDRLTRFEEEQDFEEEKEFIIKGGKQKKLGTIGKLTGAMRRAAGSISFMLTADNRDKLRNEYKSFIQKLYNKKIISKDNFTAQEVLQIILSKAPNQEKELVSITGIYEEVRYGTKYPEDSELKIFKRNIIEVTKNIQQMK